jgi:hypothetical protein
VRTCPPREDSWDAEDLRRLAFLTTFPRARPSMCRTATSSSVHWSRELFDYITSQLEGFVGRREQQLPRSGLKRHPGRDTLSAMSTEETDSSATRLPKKIYLDQNVYGHMLDQGAGEDWRKSPMGIELEAAERGLRARLAFANPRRRDDSRV